MERTTKIKGKMGIRGEEIESFTEKLGRRRWREEKERERNAERKKRLNWRAERYGRLSW